MLTPAQYAILHGADLYDWQIEALEAVGNGWPTTLLTCNGAGKTAVVARWAVRWFFYAYPQGKLAATSGSFNQLQNQLWPAIKQDLPASWGYTNGTSPCTITTPEGGRGIGFSTNDAGKAEGFHPTINNDTDPVFILVDEAKTVPEGIFEAFDRCTKRFQLYISSTGAPRGRFYDSHHKLGAEYYRIVADYTRCPHIDPEKVERDRRVFGENHPLFRSMHKAEFTADNDRLILSPDKLTKSLESQPEKDENGEVVAFCDFAAGRDENVLAIRRGNSVRIVKAWRESDTIQAARTFADLFQKHELKQHQIWGDADGLGIGFIHSLAEMRWHINKFHGGIPASDTTQYFNLIGEIWHVGAREIEMGRINLGQLDPQTYQQLTTRRSEWSENGKLRAESKDKMAKQGLSSPDRADALLGAIGCGSRMHKSTTKDQARGAYIERNVFAGDTITDF